MSGKTLADYKAPYPEPTADQKRYVIYLDPKANEDANYKLQLVPGRVDMVDGVNQHVLGGTIEEKTLNGWGYTYYVVTLGNGASTLMMGFGEAAEKRPRFVSMHSDKLIRYNSRLPVVVYVPKDAELRYRIWSTIGGADDIVAKEE